jgi:hypothetical protein
VNVFSTRSLRIASRPGKVIGLSVARSFEWQSLDDSTRRGLERAAVVGEQIVDDATFSPPRAGTPPAQPMDPLTERENRCS